MNVVLQLRLEKRYFGVLGRIRLWLLLWGMQSNMAVLMLCGRWLSCLPCWAALLVQVKASSVLRPLLFPVAGDPLCCPSMSASALSAVSSWLRITCCVASCRCGQACHPSESWRPGFRSPAQVFWIWCIAWEPFGCWAFRYLDIVVGMKATRKAADRKILLRISSGGIKLRCSLNSSLPLFGLGLLVCSMSEEYFLSRNTCSSGMALIRCSQKLREANVGILTVSHIFYTDTGTFLVNWWQNIRSFFFWPCFPPQFKSSYEVYLWSKDINKIFIFLVLQIWLKNSLLETWQTLPWYANSGDGIGEITWLLKNYIWESHWSFQCFIYNSAKASSNLKNRPNSGFWKANSYAFLWVFLAQILTSQIVTLFPP